jgi:hypothetical protein
MENGLSQVFTVILMHDDLSSHKLLDLSGTPHMVEITMGQYDQFDLFRGYPMK